MHSSNLRVEATKSDRVEAVATFEGKFGDQPLQPELCSNSLEPSTFLKVP